MFSCSEPISGHYANPKNMGACPIDCRKVLDNIYRSISHTCRPKDKTYIYAQLKELIHSITVERMPEYDVIYGSKPAREKRGEGETIAK
jgi:hypothetical protein